LAAALGFHGGLWLPSWSECVAVVAAAPTSGGGAAVAAMEEMDA